MGLGRDIKELLKLADSLINTGETLHAQFNGKSPKEAMNFLKGNIAALRSPETLQNLQKTLQSQSPKELASFLSKAHTSLSAADALKIAEILTSDDPQQKLPDYLDKKIKNPEPVRMPRLGKKKKGPSGKKVS